VQEWECRYCDPVAAAAYAIFGRPDIAGSGTYAVSTLAPEQRLFMQEVVVDTLFGYIAPAGDFNHDGYGDFLVSAPGEDDPFPNAGTCYVVYGGPHLTGGTLDLTTLDGTNGFIIRGCQRWRSAAGSVTRPPRGATDL
jgi:hypothetical protein